MVAVKYGPITKYYAKGLTVRRTLLIFGLLLAAVGVAGFFLESNAGDAFHLDTGQNITYLIIGLASLYVGAVWSSESKRIFLGIAGVLFFGVAIAGFAIAGGESHDLGIFDVQNPWENIVHVVLGLLFLSVVFYPRRFRDYSVGPNVSD